MLVILSPVILFLSKFSKKVVAEVFKIPFFPTFELGLIDEFKLQIAIHYNIEPIKKTTKMGFEPTQAREESLGRHFPRCHQLFSRKYAVK